MPNLFATTGMTITTILVIILELLSLIAMGAILLVFWRVQRKQQDLFRTLHSAPKALVRHTVLQWIYALATLAIGFLSSALYLFQPHIL